MKRNRQKFVTPTGTILYSHLKEKRKTDFKGRPLSEDKQAFEFTLQIEKSHPAINNFIAQLSNFATKEYAFNPQVQAFIAQGIGGGFAFKIHDTDIMKAESEARGKIFKGDVGCYHIRFSSKFPIMACELDMGSVKQVPIDRIYDGCICDVSLSVSINGELDQGYAGLYLNPQTIRFISDGTPRGGTSLEDQFANAPTPYIPEGVTVAAQPMPMQQQSMQQQPMHQPQPHNAILDAQPQQTDAYIDDGIPF